MRFKTIYENVNSKFKKFNTNGIEFTILEFPTSIKLSALKIPKELRKQGLGTEFMEELVKYADQKKKLVVLTPSKDFGATSKNRLIKFYKRFGFVENKGRKIDYEISDYMYRLPN